MRKAYSAIIFVLIVFPQVFYWYNVLLLPPSTEQYLSSYSAENYEKPPGGRVLHVEHGSALSSIQQAVNMAQPGDKIIIGPGVYTESVTIEYKPWLSIMGTNREKVILSGENKLGNGIYVLASNHVEISNITVRDYLGNGIMFVKSDYFSLKYVDSINNRIYGLYALGSRNGIFSHVSASGSGDSGLYVGEVSDCNCTIEYSEAYGNVLGYSGTRATGVTIRNSFFHNNSVGIGPNTLMPNIASLVSGKWTLPIWAGKNVIVNNLIKDNNNKTVKSVGWAATYGVPIGTGIALIGSPFNLVANNTISGNMKWGIAEWYFLVPPFGNVFQLNTFENNGKDFWRDGTGFFGCEINEAPGGDRPYSCSLPYFLRLYFPNPFKEVELLVNVGSPGRLIVVPLLIAAVVSGSGQIRNRKKRLASGLIDMLVVSDIYLLLAFLLAFSLFGVKSLQSGIDATLSLTLLLFPLSYFIWATLWVVYGLVTEALGKATLGKKMLGLRLQADRARILLRNILRYIDLSFLSLPAIILIALIGKTPSQAISEVEID